MSVAVDDRIVRFSVDDSSLVKKGPSVVDMLGKMKEALNFSHSAKGLQDIEKAAKKINWESMASGAEVFTNKISALSIMGITAIQRYTNQALNAVENFAKELTTRPIFTGFSEYEIKMDAIQTILTNTAKAGTTLDDVNRVLGDLNQYADLTIYNFAEMTRNIGTFTAAGIGLDDAAAAIKGISNVAAASGVNATKAAGAMYQLSQGMASGVIRLQDWMSIETAGMGGQLFQNALIETARVHGVAIDEMIKDQGTFRLTLQEGWLTAEIMSETLQKFTGDLTDEQLRAIGYSEEQIASIQETAKNAVAAATEVKTVTQLIDTMKESVQSGWSVSWEYIIGDKQQATETLTRIKDAFDAMIAPSTEARNNALKIWNELGGREAAIEGLVNVFSGIKSVIDSISSGIDYALPDLSGYDLINLSLGFQKLTEGFVLSDDASKNLRETVHGLITLLKLFAESVSGVTPYLRTLLNGAVEVTERFLDFTGSLGGWIINLYDSEDRIAYISDSIDALKTHFKELIDTARSLGGGPMFDRLNVFLDETKRVLGLATTGLDNVSTGLDESSDAVFSRGSETISRILLGVVSFVSNAVTVLQSILSVIGSAVAYAADCLRSFFSAIGNVVATLAGTLAEAWTIDEVRDGFLVAMIGGFGIAIKKALSITQGTLNPLNSIVGSVVSVFENLSDSSESIKVAFENIGGAFGSLKSAINARTVLTIAGAVAILAISMRMLSDVNLESVAVSFAAVSGLLVELVTVIKTLKTVDVSGIGAASASMFILAASVAIMAAALNSVSQVASGNDAVSSLAVLAGAIAVLIGSAKILSTYMKGSGRLILVSMGIMALSIAIRSLGKTVKILGSIDNDTLERGLNSLGALLLELAVFTMLVKSSNLAKSSGALLALSASLAIITASIVILGQLSADKALVGVGSVAAVMIALSVSMALLRNFKIGSVALNLLALSTAITMLLIPIAALGTMDSDKVVRGLSSLGVIAAGLVVVVAALSVLNKYVGGFTGIAVSITIMAIALNMLVPPIVILGSLPFDVVTNGLLIIAGAIGMLGLSAVILSPLSGALLAVAASLAVFGLSVLGIGVGIFALSAAFAALSGITTVGAAAVVGALTTILGGLTLLIPDILSALGTGIVEMITAIAISLIDNAGIVLDKLGELLDIFCKWILDHGPVVIGTVVFIVLELILTLMQAIAEYTQPLADAFVDMVLACINSIAKTIRENSHEIMAALRNLMSAIIEFILVAIAELLRLIPGVGEELSETVLGWKETVQKTLAPESMEDIAEDAVGGLEKGFRDGADDVGNAADTITKKIEDAMSGLPSSLQSTGENAGEGLVQGLLKKKKRIREASADVAGTIVNAANDRLQVNSPARTMIRTGKFAGEGLAIGLLSFVGKVSDAGHKVGDATIKAVEDSIKTVWDILNGDLDLSPRIVPVVDMSNVRNSAAYINRALRLNRPLAVSTVSTANDIAESISSARGKSASNNGSAKSGDTYNYYQTINSPKPVNRFEIYRQTKTLISRKKGGA